MRAESGVAEIISSELAKGFKLARDKALARYEVRSGEKGYQLFDLSTAGLKWGSPRKFLDQLDRVVWDVVLVTTWGSYDEKGFEETHQLYAADFWARLRGKLPVERK